MTTSSSGTPVRSRKKWIAIGSGLAVAALIILVFAASVVSGYGLNVRAFASAAMNTVRAMRDHQAITANEGDYKNVIFLHHSVGHNLIEQGAVRELFTQAGYQFWDHDYNSPGLTDPSGKVTGYNYNVPNDNTDPDGLLRIFTQPAYGLPLNTLSGLLQHEVVVFKSCFPASSITSEAQLEERKAWYLKMRDTIDQHPERLFILVTPPPLNPAETNLSDARRARAIADWLKSDDFLKGHDNLYTFDLFGALAEPDPAAADFNMLRAAYRTEADSHPNLQANQTIASDFVSYVTSTAEQFKQLSQSR
jgi:hypothetical protein